MEVSMAKDPPLKEWTTAEIDALGLSADDMQPRNGLRIMTEAEIIATCAPDMQKIGGEFEIETLRRHRKIRRRGKARAGKGQLKFNLKPGDDR
jgi:hypothetical protein